MAGARLEQIIKTAVERGASDLHITASTRAGSARNPAARSRIGANVFTMVSASTRLQSRQPHPAERHCSATSVTASGGEK